MVNFLQHIFHTGHQNSKWQQNETFFCALHGSFQILIFDSKLVIYQGNTSCNKICVKIIHYQLSIWAADGIFRKSNNFQKFSLLILFPWQQTCILIF